MNDNTCVCCGAQIPEGRQICPKCEKGDDTGMELVFDEESGTWGEAPEVYGVINCPTKEDYEYVLNAIKTHKQLEDKHWSECRQIAHYENELKEYREDDWKKAEEEMPEPWYIVLVWREIGTMEMATWARNKWLSENHSRPLSDVKYWRTLKIPKEERRNKNDT